LVHRLIDWWPVSSPNMKQRTLMARTKPDINIPNLTGIPPRVRRPRTVPGSESCDKLRLLSVIGNQQLVIGNQQLST
jgi:hypothetical protein